MAEAGDGEFQLRPLAVADRFKGMKSGDAAFLPLKNFAKTKAQGYEAANLARTYVITDESLVRPAAYVTLVCDRASASSPPPSAPERNRETPQDPSPSS